MAVAEVYLLCRINFALAKCCVGQTRTTVRAYAATAAADSEKKPLAGHDCGMNHMWFVFAFVQLSVSHLGWEEK